MLATSTYQIFGVCWLRRRLKSGQKKNSSGCYTNIEILQKDGFSQHNGWHIRNHHFPSFQMSYGMSLGATGGFQRPVCISFLHFGKLHCWLFTPLAKMLKISITEVYFSAIFIIQLNLHSPLTFLLNLAGTHAHIRQVGRAALPVTVPTKPQPCWNTERTLLRRLWPAPSPGRYGQYTPWQHIPAHFPSAAGQLGYDWAELLWTEANFKLLQTKQKSEFPWQTS